MSGDLEARFRREYPGAWQAALLHEHMILADVWSAIRRKGVGSEEVLEILKTSARQTLEAMPGMIIGEIKPQLDHPDFLRYIESKLKES